MILFFVVSVLPSHFQTEVGSNTTVKNVARDMVADAVTGHPILEDPAVLILLKMICTAYLFLVFLKTPNGKYGGYVYTVFHCCYY